MEFRKICILLVSSIVITVSYSSEKITDVNNIELYQKDIKYPYKASKKRLGTILNNISSLKKGMSEQEVIEAIDKPDEIHLTYTTLKNTRTSIGFQFVYLIQRNKSKGSQKELNEKSIRVHFDNSRKLILSYSFGIKDYLGIEK